MGDTKTEQRSSALRGLRARYRGPHLSGRQVLRRLEGHRDFGRKQWGDEGYAQEELVAELGAAFLCLHLELASEPREENASYIGTWLGVLKNDARFIFKAAARALRAADYLRGFSRG